MTPEEIESLKDVAGIAVTENAYKEFGFKPEGTPNPTVLREANHEKVIEAIQSIIGELVTKHADDMSPDHNVNIRAIRLCVDKIYRKEIVQFPVDITLEEADQMFRKSLKEAGHSPKGALSRWLNDMKESKPKSR